MILMSTVGDPYSIQLQGPIGHFDGQFTQLKKMLPARCELHAETEISMILTP